MKKRSRFLLNAMICPDRLGTNATICQDRLGTNVPQRKKRSVFAGIREDALHTPLDVWQADLPHGPYHGRRLWALEPLLLKYGVDMWLGEFVRKLVVFLPTILTGRDLICLMLTHLLTR